MTVSVPTLILVALVTHTECLQDPQTYVVQMNHHQELIMTEDDVKQDGDLYLSATNKYYKLFNRKRSLQDSSISETREKRQQEVEKKESADSLMYETNDQQYEGSFEGIEGANNRTYDYEEEKLKNEYYNEERTEKYAPSTNQYEYNEETEATASTFSEDPSNKLKATEKTYTSTENYCNVVLLFRIRVIQCFWFGVNHNNKDLTERAGWVLAFWLAVYTSIACYLWCTKGWCCCCCPCSLCHPRDVFQEAQKYLAQNPPGVATLGPNDTVTYIPSDFEVSCYEELKKEVFNL